METALIVGLIIMLGIVGIYAHFLHKNNSNLHKRMSDLEQKRMSDLEQKISASVEERLVNHTKYCETMDLLVQQYLDVESKKWRELIVAETCRMNSVLAKGRKDFSKKKEELLEEVLHQLEKQMMNFKALMQQTYLDEYEKMRHNPPRPKKGPMKRVDPPQRYRNLDDDFSFMPAEPKE